MTAKEVLRVLGECNSGDGYAFLSQVRNGTGYGKSVRTADAICMSLWPSRGLQIEGFEIKVSKSDWKSELKDPAKADEFFRFCDMWWIVTPPGIVDVKELPKTWGLIEIVDGKTKIKVQAPQNQHAVEPDRLFIGALLRNITKNCIALEAIEDKLHEARELGRQASLNGLDYQTRKDRELRKKVEEFEKETGLSFDDWQYDSKKLGQAVRTVLDGRHVKAKESLLKLKEKAENIAKFIGGEKIDSWQL